MIATPPCYSGCLISSRNNILEVRFTVFVNTSMFKFVGCLLGFKLRAPLSWQCWAPFSSSHFQLKGKKGEIWCRQRLAELSLRTSWISNPPLFFFMHLLPKVLLLRVILGHSFPQPIFFRYKPYLTYIRKTTKTWRGQAGLISLCFLQVLHGFTKVLAKCCGSPSKTHCSAAAAMCKTAGHIFPLPFFPFPFSPLSPYVALCEQGCASKKDMVLKSTLPSSAFRWSHGVPAWLCLS